MRLCDLNVINEALADTDDLLDRSEYDLCRDLSERSIESDLSEDEQAQLDTIEAKLAAAKNPTATDDDSDDWNADYDED